MSRLNSTTGWRGSAGAAARRGHTARTRMLVAMRRAGSRVSAMAFDMGVAGPILQEIGGFGNFRIGREGACWPGWDSNPREAFGSGLPACINSIEHGPVQA